MYKIAMVNMGSDMVTKDFTINVDGEFVALIAASERCLKVLGYTDFIFMCRGIGEYEVRRGMVLVGSLTITKLS